MAGINQHQIQITNQATGTDIGIPGTTGCARPILKYTCNEMSAHTAWLSKLGRSCLSIYNIRFVDTPRQIHPRARVTVAVLVAVAFDADADADADAEAEDEAEAVQVAEASGLSSW